MKLVRGTVESTAHTSLKKPPVIRRTVGFSTMPALCRNVMKQFTSVPAEWTPLCAVSCSSVLSKFYFLRLVYFYVNSASSAGTQIPPCRRMLGLNQRLLNYIDDNASINRLYSAGWFGFLKITKLFNSSSLKNLTFLTHCPALLKNLVWTWELVT
jgi:hypothetical protein